VPYRAKLSFHDWKCETLVILDKLSNDYTMLRRIIVLSVLTVLAGLLVVAAMLVLVDGASGSASTGLPSPQELPPSAVAVVLHPPVDLETISTADFKRAIVQVQAAAQGHLNRTPRPGQKGYAKLKMTAMGNLLDES